MFLPVSKISHVNQTIHGFSTYYWCLYHVINIKKNVLHRHVRILGVKCNKNEAILEFWPQHKKVSNNLVIQKRTLNLSYNLSNIIQCHTLIRYLLEKYKH